MKIASNQKRTKFWRYWTNYRIISQNSSKIKFWELLLFLQWKESWRTSFEQKASWIFITQTNSFLAIIWNLGNVSSEFTGKRWIHRYWQTTHWEFHLARSQWLEMRDQTFERSGAKKAMIQNSRRVRRKSWEEKVSKSEWRSPKKRMLRLKI